MRSTYIDLEDVLHEEVSLALQCALLAVFFHELENKRLETKHQHKEAGAEAPSKSATFNNTAYILKDIAVLINETLLVLINQHIHFHLLFL